MKYVVHALVLMFLLRTLMTPTSTSTPLVSWMVRGGLCASGSCLSSLTIFADGRYVSIHGSGSLQRAGMVERRLLMQLRHAIMQTNFHAIRSHRFSGTCPTAYDGTEVIYTFYTTHPRQVLSSCQVVFPHNFLFQLLQTLQSWYG